MMAPLRWLLAVTAALATALPAAVAAPRPNFVLIVADDLGYADLGIHGNKDVPTPHIDSIAQDGVRCSSGYVSGPYCSPTRAGLLTGRYQQRFGHEFNPGQATSDVPLGLSLDEQTLPAQLKSAGYRTAMVGKWHLGNAPQFHPLQRGFDQFYGFLGGAHPYFPGATPNNPILRGTEVVDEQAYLTDAFAREAVGFLKSHSADQPFFLYLTFNAVHTPMQAPKDLQEKFNGIADQRRRNYAGMLSSMDNAIGQVLGTLKERQFDQNTLVVFISDNGGPEANGSNNAPLNGHKATTWEGGVRVPFFLKWPGTLPAGVVYEQPVIQLDLFPTLAAAAGVTPSGKALDGVDLVPYLSGKNTAAPHEALYWRFGEQFALRSGDWKLVKVRGDQQPRLYNLAKDIGESQDLASSEPERLKELQSAWNDWNTTLVPPKWIPNPQQQNRPRNNKKAAAAAANK